MCASSTVDTPGRSRAGLRPARTLIVAMLALFVAALAASGCGGRDPDLEPLAQPSSSVVVTTTTTGSDTDDEGATSSTAPDAEDGAEAEPGDEDGDGAAGSSVWTETGYRLVEVTSLDQPIAMATRPGSDHVWVAERAGRVRLVERVVDGDDVRYATVDEPVIDISGSVSTSGEGGLLGLTFGADGDHLYLSYTNRTSTSVLAEYAMVGDRADPDTGRILLQVEQPFDNHNGGQVTLGPDGLLYLGLGDGGGGGDPLDNGQNTSTLLGTILRIDPDNPGGEAGYGVPADNPFADGSGGRPEIWLYGVRNPWRFSFDRDTGDLWIGDVGQNAVEEITHLPAVDGQAGRGANLGWRSMEGDLVFEGDGPPPDHRGPIYTYGHEGGGCSVTGGYVYRGDRIPELRGVYLFTDFCSGELSGLQPVDEGLLVARLTTDPSAWQVASFGEDVDGELYVLSLDGPVYVIDRAG